MEEVPHRTTVELMARELGAIAELQTAETALETSNTTFGFDAITQGVHINGCMSLCNRDILRFMWRVQDKCGFWLQGYAIHAHQIAL